MSTAADPSKQSRQIAFIAIGLFMQLCRTLSMLPEASWRFMFLQF
jgi:hypothetical protein